MTWGVSGVEWGEIGRGEGAREARLSPTIGKDRTSPLINTDDTDLRKAGASNLRQSGMTWDAMGYPARGRDRVIWKDKY